MEDVNQMCMDYWERTSKEYLHLNGSKPFFLFWMTPCSCLGVHLVPIATPPSETHRVQISFLGSHLGEENSR
jgi:hypothetical protein